MIYFCLRKVRRIDNFMMKPFLDLLFKCHYMPHVQGTPDFSCHGHLETGSVVHTWTTTANVCLCCPSEHVGTWIYLWWTDKHCGTSNCCCVPCAFSMVTHAIKSVHYEGMWNEFPFTGGVLYRFILFWKYTSITLLTKKFKWINSLWPSDATWWHTSRLT